MWFQPPFRLFQNLSNQSIGRPESHVNNVAGKAAPNDLGVQFVEIVSSFREEILVDVILRVRQRQNSRR